MVVLAATLMLGGCGGGDDNTEARREAAPAIPVVEANSAKSAPDQAILDELPKLPPATEDTPVPKVEGFAKGKNKRVRGSRNMTLGQFMMWSATSANRYWSRVFARAGIAYKPAYVVIIDSNEQGRSNCDGGTVVTSGDGPFYCPADYACSPAAVATARGCGEIFLTADWFFRNPRNFGDFAISMVVAHEWGHHVQNLMGILNAKATGRLVSLQTELQADCLAGAWSNSVYYQRLLERGDVEEAARFAWRIGDDLPWDHPQAHGSPAQRAKWFMYGYNTGSANKCRTY